MRRLRLIPFTPRLALLTVALFSLPLAAAPEPAADEPQAVARHADDLKVAREWWDEGKLSFPTATAERLAKWVADHPADGESLYRLALLRSRNGPDLPRNMIVAVDLLTRAVDAGYEGAKPRLGLWKITGKDMPRDEAGGHRLLDPLAEKEDPEALLCLGVATLPADAGDGVAFDRAASDRAEDLFRRALERGNTKAHAWLAGRYFRRGLDKDAIALLQKGIGAGDVYSKTRLAREYLWLGQTAKLIEDARGLLREAADWGDIDAQTELALLDRRGEHSTFRAAGTRWLQIAAKGGDRLAQYHLATAYLRGEGSTSDAAGAVVTLSRMADKGDVDAAALLAEVYLEGVWVPRDEIKARQYLRGAAEIGRRKARVLMWGLNRDAVPRA
jgi:TPR repeat protein